MSKRRKRKKNKNRGPQTVTIERNQKQNPNNNYQDVPRDPQQETGSINPPMTQQHSDNQSWDNKQKGFWERQITLAKFLNWITAGAAIVALGGLIILYKQIEIAREQIEVAKKQIEIAQEQLRVAHRPWVALAELPKVVEPLIFNARGARIGFS